MELFYKLRYENKDNKRYLVLKPIPQRIMIILVLLFIMIISVSFMNSMQKYFGDNYLTFITIIMILFTLSIILYSKDHIKVTIARIEKKEIIIKGGTTIFNFKNPLETWIEQ